jgi:hypothetical protein
MINIVSDLYNMKFKNNAFADKKHEKSVEDILIANGLNLTIDVEILEIMKNRDNNFKIINSLKGKMFYIKQPFGSQKQPDFIICVDGFILWIECKSGKNNIVWNTGFPKKDILYVFSNKTKNCTTLFLGQETEIVEKYPNFEKEYNDFCQEVQQYCKDKWNNIFPNFNMFSHYYRRMLNDKTKYHLERKAYMDRLLDTFKFLKTN